METDGLMFPKSKTRKKRMRHPASILHNKGSRTCYLCILLHDDHRLHTVLHEHHIFDGANRIHSEEYGLKVYLCINHHLSGYGPEAVHSNAEIMRLLQQIGQQAFEDQIGSRQEFMRIFGRNYRED